nr:MAG TPA: Major capsid protein [Microviridae sp.]
MKLINPFDRLKKRNSVPLSLFPASKKTATTMPIGRLVPLYCIDMIQGNRLKISVEQLTRFMEMNGPLMQNYTITFGAYFVPYVSLDHFFDSAWFTQNAAKDSKIDMSKALSARDFFNPATPDVLRVGCRFMATHQQNCVGNGSLWQHLGLPYVKMRNDLVFDVAPVGSGTLERGISLEQLYLNVAYLDAEIDYKGVTITNFYTFVSRKYLSGLIGLSPYAFMRHHFFNIPIDTDGNSVPSWESVMGTTTITAVYYDYIKSVNMECVSATEPETYPTYNLYRWLAYMRIYSDWFLNPIYTACEDFRDMIGYGYLAYTGDDAGVGAFVENFDTTNNAKLKADPTLDFFAQYVRNGQCFPVLWKKDQLTSIVQTDAASSVAIGTTIGENFYNRMYAKFKDLVARMGKDYRSNTTALYGHSVGDNSLQRSQVIGYKSFDIKVGEIAQTSKSDKDSNLGSFAGYALSRDFAGMFDWTAEENGMVMICAYVRPQYIAIAGQVDKSVYKGQYLDYLIPEFGGVGYQSVQAARFDFTQPSDKTLGLEERYAEYMSVPNEVSGDMLDAYSYLTSDRLFPQLYQFGSADFYKNLYMWDTEQLHRVFQNTLNDPVALVAFFDGTVTRQLPATIRTDF